LRRQSCSPLPNLLLCLHLLSRTRPPPLPTLFPYTTLFRSLEPQGRRIGLRQDDVGIDPTTAVHGSPAVRLARGTTRRVAQDGRRDRKSTRLNSGHQIISYAVFCLKKKKKHKSTQKRQDNTL